MGTGIITMIMTTVTTMVTDTITSMVAGITTIVTTMTSARPGLARWPCCTFGVLPLPIWGEGWGEGVTGQIERPNPLTPPLSLWEREQTEPAASLCTHEPGR